MTGPDGLVARIADLERADEAIADAARRADARALLAAIGARAPVAASLLRAIAEDDLVQQARLRKAADRGRDTSALAAWLGERDDVMEALVRTVDARTREYDRILRAMVADRRRWR